MVVISPAIMTKPVLVSVSQATRARRILGQDGVEDGVGDLVADLVGVPLGDRFRGEEKIAHVHVAPCEKSQVKWNSGLYR